MFLLLLSNFFYLRCEHRSMPCIFIFLTSDKSLRPLKQLWPLVHKMPMVDINVQHMSEAFFLIGTHFVTCMVHTQPRKHGAYASNVFPSTGVLGGRYISLIYWSSVLILQYRTYPSLVYSISSNVCVMAKKRACVSAHHYEYRLLLLLLLCCAFSNSLGE
jgi:hypothetical protein